MRWIPWRISVGILLFLCAVAGAPSPSLASDKVFAALAQRGLVPWPEAFLAELPFQAGSNGSGMLEGKGYALRLSRATPAKMALVAVPGRIVIVDILPEQGAVGLSAKALEGLQIVADAAPVQMQILALRPAGASSGLGLASAPPAGVATSPLPRPRPVREVQQQHLGDALAAEVPEAGDPTLGAASGADQHNEGPMLLEQQAEPAAPASEADEDDPIGTLLSFLTPDSPSDENEAETTLPDVSDVEAAPPVVEALEVGDAETVSTEPADIKVSVLNSWAEPQGGVVQSRLGLQVGLFGSESNAQRLSRQLEESDLPVVIREIINSQGELRWKVMVGPFSSEDSRRHALRVHGEKLLKGAYPIMLN